MGYSTLELPSLKRSLPSALIIHRCQPRATEIDLCSMAAASPNVGASQSSGGRESVSEYSGANYHTFPPPNLLHMESHELRHIYTHTHTYSYRHRLRRT